MKCPRCQHENPSGVSFCGECGARLETLCPGCQASNPPTNKFCHKCGAPLTHAMSPAKRKASWSAVGLFFLVLSFVAASAQGTAWEKHMEAATKAYQQGRYAEAEKSFQAALKEAEGFGPQDPRFATSLNNLAELYRLQGRYADAELLHQRALAILGKAGGPNGGEARAPAVLQYPARQNFWKGLIFRVYQVVWAQCTR